MIGGGCFRDWCRGGLSFGGGRERRRGRGRGRGGVGVENGASEMRGMRAGVGDF